MSRYRVELSARARRELQRITRWWKENRQGSPHLLEDEFTAAGAMLATHPESAPVAPRYASVRRLFLPRTRYAIYYEVVHTERRVVVLAIWHTARGQEPRL